MLPDPSGFFSDDLYRDTRDTLERGCDVIVEKIRNGQFTNDNTACKMKTFKCDDAIEVLGVVFNGVNEMLEYARKSEPKDGVYVDVDSELYPCFDSSDYFYEDRCYTNMVFATTRMELELKMKKLSEMSVRGVNYNKLTGALHPMLYWAGDKHYDVFLTESEEDEPCSR